MKTTVDLPDDLMHAVKIRAVNEKRKLGVMIAELLRRGLARGQGGAATNRTRVRLPLVQCVHGAAPGREMTPARVAEVLLEQEARESSAEHDASVR